jgi:death-on-curing protein
MARAVPDEPRWISEEMLLALHAQQIERFGGAHGIIDQNVVLSALARPRHRWAYDEAAALPELAAAYWVGFARSQGFSDGNKRTGLSTMLVFLALNGVRLHVPPQELYALTMAIANGQADDESSATYIRSRLPQFVVPPFPPG